MRRLLAPAIALFRATLVAGLALAMPGPVRADTPDRAALAPFSAWLDALTTARAPFTQINADGSISTGTITLHRPGRARFEYDPPDTGLVIVGGGAVHIFDLKTRQPPETYPLSRTPLSLILGEQIDLAGSDMVAGMIRDDLTTTLIARDPKAPEQGELRLVFTNDPVELRQWVLVDANGDETTVILGALDRGFTPPARLFDAQAEARALSGAAER